MNARTAAVADLEQRIGYTFHDRARLERSLTHASVGDGARKAGDNERLEFLGDRVLGLLTAERLIAADPHATEGDLAPRLNALVNRATCARVARRMDLGPALRLSGAETKAGGREKDSILAGACEAVIAALYEDGGLEAARAVFLAFWTEEFAAIQAPRPKDSKTRLQEWAQSKGRPLPAYRVTDRQGPEHAPLFTVEAVVEGFEAAAATGSSRQAAEKAAAQALLDREGVA
ncbi:MAG: ribonuclease III [Caulobacteraceae bacterium]